MQQASLKENPEELRIFVSSTFQDLREEREYLAKHVFPPLRAMCRERGIALIEIDLRWGLTEEEASLGKTIRSCLEEIDRCRPYFIGIIGDRYGWLPSLLDVQKDPVLLRQYSWVEEAVIQGASIVDLEFQYAALQHAEAGTCFYIRKPDSDREDLPARLADLRGRVRNSGCVVREFETAPDFAAQIFIDFSAIIAKLWPVATEPTESQEEHRTHEAFGVARRRAYIANATNLQFLLRAVRESTTPIVVTGTSGIGKSALLAYFAAFYHRIDPEAIIISHFIGASSSSARPESIVRNIIEQIKVKLGVEDEIPEDSAALFQDLPQWLARAQERKIVLMIDALNQLEPEGRNLEWLPTFLPSNIRLILSSTPGQFKELFDERGYAAMDLAELQSGEREALAVRYLGEYHKGLNRTQLRRVAEHTLCSSPLFLKTLLEELRLYGTFEDLDSHLDDYLKAESIDGLFQLVLARMEKDYGEQLVRETLGAIWAARYGLSKTELLEATGLDTNHTNTFLAALDYHLMEREGLLTFFHEYLRKAVESRYATTDEAKRAHRSRIARFFRTQPASERRIQEEPWLWREAEDWEELKNTLTNRELLLLLEEDQYVYEYAEYWTALGSPDEMAEAYAAAQMKWQAEEIAPTTRIALSRCLAEVLDVKGKYQEAEELLQSALTEAEQTFGLESQECIQLMGRISGVEDNSGKYSSAAEFAQRAIDMAERIPNFPRREMIQLLQNSGKGYFRKGDYMKAEIAFLQQSELETSLHGSQSINATSGLTNLGVLMIATKDFSRAEQYFRRVIRLTARSPISSLQRANDINNLGTALLKLGNFAEAILLLQEALVMRENALGPMNPTVIGTLVNLGVGYFENQNIALAEKYFDEVIHRATLSTLFSNRSKANAIRYLGEIAEQRGLKQVAMLKYETALKLQLNLLGNAHPDTQKTLSRIQDLSRPS